jgi:hypothetical protein
LPIRKSRPAVEWLETRLAPANVDVLTYHYDSFLGGSNTQETMLTPANVNVNSFGKLFTQAVDGYVYATPLYKAQLAIPGQGTRDVAFIATEHDSVYAFDANTGAQLWRRCFISGCPGVADGVGTMPSGDTNSGDIVPEIGITGTPVIDGTTGTMYVTAKTKETRADGNHYVFKVHAINITNGLDRAANAEVTISDTLGTDDNANNINTNVTWPGDGAGTLNHVIRFNARREHHRAATTILGSNVYITFASHGDNGPYHGWIVGYRMSDLSLQKVFNTSANARAGGIWQSGGGLATDGTNLFFATGNTFSGPQPGFSPPNGNYGETVLKVDTTGAGQAMTARDYFTPFNWQALDNGDTDLGSGGTMMLPDYVGSAAHQHLMVELGKQGKIYLIDRGNATDTNTMGKVNNPPTGPDLVVQTVTAGQAGVWGNPSFLQTSPTEGIIYYHGSGDVARGYHITNGHIDDVNVLHSATTFGFPGGQPIESSNGVNLGTGVVWDLRVDNYSGTGPATLFAYRADNLATLYTSNDAGQADQFGASVKFIAATQTNGHVLVGARGTFSVFGLFPSHATAPAARTALSGMGLPGGTQITLNWTNPDSLANRIRIERSLNMATGFSEVGIVGGSATTFTDSGLTPATHYFYRIRAANDQGFSPYTATLPVDSRIGIPNLAVTHVSSGQIDLSWTSTGNAGYRLDRQFNGGAFSTLLNTPDPTRTTYTDTDPMLLAQRGVYTYRVTAMNTNPTDSADSNLASGANTILPIDHMAGFADPPVGPGHADLTANGDSQFAEGFARLTQAINGQNGTIFANQRVGVSTFDTTFQYRVHEGSDPRADGATFTIQTNSATTLGIGGGGLGYGPDHTGPGRGIRNSLAVKFNFYVNAEGGGNNTGVFTDGRAPTIRDPGLPPTPTAEIPDISVNLAGSGVDLNNQSPKLIRLTYNGTILSERIEDTVSHAVFTHDYPVNLQAIIGSDTAWVGFTGATGGLNAVQDVQTWVFNPGVTAPAAPDQLQVTSASGANAVDLRWRSNSVNETGFVIERSHDNVNFAQVGSVGVAVQTFHDDNVPQGLFFYRVRAVNAQGASSASGTVRANVGRAAVLVDHVQGFASHDDLQANGAASFATPLGNFSADQDIGTGGNPTAAGNASFAGGTGTYRLQASGSDIWDTADHFHYAYRPLSGDGEIVARLATLTNQDFWTKGGLMIRDNLTAGSPNAFMFGTSSPDHEEPVFQWRDSQNGGSADFGNHINHLQATPVWLRLTRTGNSFSGFWAHDNGDGTHGAWNQIGSAHTVPGMGTNVFVGLGLTEHNNQAQLATATYDHVTITQGGVALPTATIARITDGGNGEAASLWKTQQVPVTGSFTTSFNVRDLPVNIGGADGMTFALQADPRGAGALGGGGGAVGYEGITHSLAVRFDIWDGNSHNPHHTLTTLYRNGVIDNSGEIDMNSAGINFLSNDPMRVDLSYDGITKVLNETVRDLKTGAVFSTNYNVDLRATIGSDTAYVGFTGGTGGASAVQDVTNWTSDFEPFINPAYVITSLPATSVAGDPQGFILSVRQGDGSPFAAYRGTVHLASSDGQASLPHDYTFTAADQGTHVFGYVPRTAGTQTIQVSDTVRDDFVDSANTTVVAAAASRLAISNSFPSPTLSGAPGNLTVTAYDPFNNVATGYTGTVTVTSSDPQATLPPPHHYQASDAGTFTFGVTLRTVGTQSITATDDSPVDALTATQANIQVTPARFVVTGFPSPITAGNTGTFTVTAVDANGNTATGYVGTVHFMSSDMQAELPDDYTFTLDDHGTHIFGAILKTAGTQSITATDTSFSPLTGSQTGIEVNPSTVAGYFVVDSFPSPIQAGTPSSVVVRVFDPYGNAAVGYTGTIHFSSTDGQATRPDDYTFTVGPGGDNGTHTFAPPDQGVTLRTAGSQSIIVTDTGNGATGSQDNILVTPSVAVSFLVSGYPSPTNAGDVHTFQVTAVDAYGNLNAIYSGTIHFSSSDLAANLPADSPLGTGTFAAAFNTPGMQSLTATDLGDPSITGTQTGIEVVGPSTPSGGAFLVGALAPTSAAPTATVGTAAAANPALPVSAGNAVAAPVTPVGGHDQQFAVPGLKQDLAGQASADTLALALSDWSNSIYAPVTDDLIRARLA